MVAFASWLVALVPLNTVFVSHDTIGADTTGMGRLREGICGGCAIDSFYQGRLGAIINSFRLGGSDFRRKVGPFLTGGDTSAIVSCYFNCQGI